MMNNEIQIPKTIRYLTGCAIGDYDMIHEGDRILIGLSGGKDSISLVHVLLQKRAVAPVKFEIGAITVDPQMQGFDPSPLKEYMRKLGVPLLFISQPIVEDARMKMEEGHTLCSYCSRMKRGIMYSTARREGYTVLALGHHLDDLAESFFMSVFQNGSLHTIKAHYRNKEGDIRIIRPLIYVREQQIRDFAHQSGFPIISSRCGEDSPHFRTPTQRRHIKQLLAQEEENNPSLFHSLLAAIKPLTFTQNGLDGKKKEVPK
jgi:tRNA 2-thiocytidine biosynthesis protein TtcA